MHWKSLRLLITNLDQNTLPLNCYVWRKHSFVFCVSFKISGTVIRTYWTPWVASEY